MPCVGEAEECIVPASDLVNRARHAAMVRSNRVDAKMRDMDVKGSCHCGRVSVEVQRAPTEVTSCNCSICRRLGTLWAYYAPADVRVVGETATYQWGDKTI